MDRDVVDHPQDERENDRGEGRNGAIALGLAFGGYGDISGVQNQQDAVHIAEALVVLIDEVTLGAPFHAIS
jgi:hypothetical protein